MTTLHSPQSTSRSTPLTGAIHIDSPSKSMTSTPSATTILSAGIDGSYAIVPIAYTKTISAVPNLITTSLTTSVGYDYPMSSGSTGFTLTTQSDHTIHDSLASASPYSSQFTPATLDACVLWEGSSANGDLSTSHSALECSSIRVPTSVPAVYDIVNGATSSTEMCRGQCQYSGTSMSAPTAWHKSPTAPQRIVSTNSVFATVVTKTTHPGSPILMSLANTGSGTPVPVTSSSSTSAGSSLLPAILCPVLGVLVVAVGMMVVRCRSRRRSTTILSTAQSSDSGVLREQKDSTAIAEIPTLPIASYRTSSTYLSEHANTYIPHAGEFYPTSNGQLSDPFVDSPDMLSSQTSIHPSRSMTTFTMNTDTRDAGRSSIDPSTSSLELRIIAPLASTDGPLIQSPYSPSWHYDSRSLTSQPSQDWNEEQEGETSSVSLRTSSPTSPKPFFLGTESTRSRLHALLEEARRVP